MSKSNYPLISIVTPSLNQGDFIEDNILSVMNQDYANFEHIIIDACSTDNTLSILKKYDHLKWTSEIDNGQSDGLNKGFLRANGKWILWLNADDFLMPNALNFFLKILIKNPDADLIYGHTKFVDENKALIKIVYHIPFIYPMSLFGVYMPPSTGSLFRADTLKNNLLSEDYHYTMDTEWFLRCGKSLHTVLVDEIVSAFRVTNQNKTSHQIRFKKTSHKHAQEQRTYRKKYVFPWDDDVPNLAKLFFTTGKSIYKLYYYIYKSRYLFIKS